jgi:hypothetical protein
MKEIYQSAWVKRRVCIRGCHRHSVVSSRCHLPTDCLTITFGVLGGFLIFGGLHVLVCRFLSFVR